ncbi:MerR family transcriptional regulator [Tindallia californiensis]|uniref:DNA-binding transcriptional regulator, MerR family n=1 Tax=Tindallia californiensis TaxID=159292 RepID=A0A1H3PSQ4_9FIRM|nr:MerR family transcriptional regulator [Tindallia californiensis]SDZ03459.1 DNA-binding transcriptional regulator, MerR family [Tindallia californiensis]
MEYNINKLAKLAGVSTRTLRYYDEIEILSPRRIPSNGYRVYGQKEVDVLQQIMFYRELGVPLDEIKKIIWSKDYDGITLLQGHLSALKEKKEQIELLISNVEKTIATSKGEGTMTDKEKFEGFKKKMIEDNEQQYGAEIREAYGDDVIDASNTKIMGLTPEKYEKSQALSQQIKEALNAAFEQQDPSSEAAQKACALHKEWLGYYWNHYSKEAHLGLAQTYVDDIRFKKYYDDIAEGCAEFFQEALKIYCQ